MVRWGLEAGARGAPGSEGALLWGAGPGGGAGGAGAPAAECDVDEVREFLDKKVREHELVFVNGEYRLPPKN